MNNLSARCRSSYFPKAFWAILVLLAAVSSNGQPLFNFEYLDISNGLPHNTVFSILQDAKGFMWFGTQDGLVRYDSRNCIIYNRNTEGGFIGKNIQSLAENKAGDLYIGTRGAGLIVKSGITGRFGPIANKELDQALSKSWIKHLMIDKSDHLWISTLDNGLWRYDQKNQTYQKFDVKNSILNSNQISSTVEDTEGNVWIASSSETLFVFDNQQAEIKPFKLPDTVFRGFRKVLYCDKKGRIWLGTEGSGLFFIDHKRKKAKQFTLQNGLSSNTITHLLEWEHNLLLIATDGGGLNVFDPEKAQFYTYKSAQGKFALNTNALYFLFADKDQNLWVATYNGGVNISKPDKLIFETYQFEENAPDMKNVKSVLSISKSASQNLWIGTDGDGVFEFNLQTKTMKDVNDLLDTKSKTIKAIYEDKFQNLWVGVLNEGLMKYNLNNRRKTWYRRGNKPGKSINGSNIWSITEDQRGDIWVAFLGGGLNKIDRKTGLIASYVHSSTDPNTISGDGAMIVQTDHQDNVWIGTNTMGLNLFDKEKNHFKRFSHNPSDHKSLSADDIRCIFLDRKTRLWIGTESGGLNLLMKDFTFEHLNTKDGLISNAVLGIAEGPDEVLWISSFNGITRFDLKDSTFQTFNFHQNSSGQTNQFNMMSSFSSNRYIGFGGINGLSIFRPAEFKWNRQKPEVIFTAFKIFNKSADISKIYNSLLKTPCNIENADNVFISYKDNTFSFQFIAIDYIHAGNMRYEYIMEGFDQQWHPTNNGQREITYTNLNPGDYTFIVRASSTLNNWGEEKKIIVTILPLYWQTWWFKTVVALAIIVLAFYLFRVYISNREMALNQAVLKSNELILQITNEKLLTEQEVLSLKNDKLEMEISSKNSDLLAQTAKIAHKNEVLQNIKKLLSEVNDSNEKKWPTVLKNLRSLIEAELEDKKYWERFQQYFDQINHNFRTNLLAKHPDLTPTDLLICTLAKLNLSNKEMALLLNLSIAGIEKSRYRLKKRLGLPRDEDLNDYLRDF